MKKNTVVFIIILFFVETIFASDFNYSIIADNIVSKYLEPFLYYKDENIILKGNVIRKVNENYKVDIGEQNSLICFLYKYTEENKNGYNIVKLTKDKSPYMPYFSFVCLEGKGIIILNEYIENKPRGLNKQENEAENSFYLRERIYNYNEIKCKENVGTYIVIEDGIKNINASSFLKESNYCYTPENLKSKLYTVSSDEFVNYEYQSLLPPWVEGVPGYGIGEWLDIDFKYKSDEVQILNGFVDFKRMYLYKENSRVKTILVQIENTKFSKEYGQQHIVKYYVIKKKKKTDHIRITIKDVYKGDKYDDTCLSSILVTDPSQPAFEEQQTQIKKLLVDSGVWKKIEKVKEEK